LRAAQSPRVSCAAFKAIAPGRANGTEGSRCPRAPTQHLEAQPPGQRGTVNDRVGSCRRAPAPGQQGDLMSSTFVTRLLATTFAVALLGAGCGDPGSDDTS